MEPGGDGGDKQRDVRRPMNAFLIFCKRHRSIVREKNPDLDNRSVTRILGDLWANLKDGEKVVYTDLAKQYKDAFMKANPDYKWHNPEKAGAAAQKTPMPKPTNVKVIRNDLEVPEGSIMPGKLADPSNMGGLSLLLIAGQQSDKANSSDTVTNTTSPKPVVAMVTPDGHTESVSPPVNKVKWGEDSLTRSIPGEITLSRVKEESSPTKSENPGTKEGISETSQFEALKSRSETSPSKPDIKVENGLSNFTSVRSDTSLGKVTGIKTESKPHYGEPVWNLDSRNRENQSRPLQQTWKTDIAVKVEKEVNNQSLLALAEMCEDKVVPVSTVPPVPTTIEAPPKPLLYQAVAAAKLPQRSLLAEAFLDTCDRGNYSDILRDNSATAKRTKGDNEFEFEKKTESVESEGSDQDEKENISKLLVTDVKSGKDSDEESPMITCGKLVVNHIIDRLFSSDIAAAARKAHVNETADVGSQDVKDFKALVHGHEEGSVNKNGIAASQKENISNSANGKADDFNYDEHDGMRDASPNINRNRTWSGGDMFSRPHKHSFSHSASNVVSSGHNIAGTMDSSNDNNHAPMVKLKPIINTDTNFDHVKSRKRSASLSVTMVREEEEDDCDDLQPVRKSRRRNRGQRYQELINEGIIQPSKERMAALKHDTPKEESSEEDFQSIDSYILPETAIRRIRKRTTSESAKDKILPVDDAKRYKTGDFDLEAHIATLPACPVESMGRKRGFIRQRHHSETTHIKKTSEDSQLPVFDIKKAVCLPPHMKIPSPEKIVEPVVGSRKRKARKHSITHLLPAPPVIAPNNSEHKPNGADLTETVETGMVKTQAENLLDRHNDLVAQPGQDTDTLAEAGQDTQKLTDNGNHSPEPHNGHTAGNGATGNQNQNSFVNGGGYSQNNNQTGSDGENNSNLCETVPQSNDTHTSGYDTKHAENFKMARTSEERSLNGDLNNVGVEYVKSDLGNRLNQNDTNHTSLDSGPSVTTAGDQSSVILQQGCGSEVRRETGARTETGLSGGSDGQASVEKKSTDMNFNTQVQC